MKSDPLHYFLHDERDAFRVELAGSLTGDNVNRAYQDWRTAATMTTSRQMIVDITFVSDVDSHGRSLLSLWHRTGARLIAALPESRAIAAGVLADSSAPSSQKQSWLWRMRNVLAAKLAWYAGIPSFAEGRRGVPAPQAPKHIESTALSSNEAGGLVRASVHREDLEAGNDSQQGLTRSRSDRNGNCRSVARGGAAARDFRCLAELCAHRSRAHAGAA